MCVACDRVETQRRRLDAGETEHVVGRRDVGFAEDRVREGNVEPEPLAVGLACKRAAHSVALPFVDHALVRDRRVLGIRRDVEDHEVADLELRCASETLEQPGRWSDEPEVDVLGGACARDARRRDRP